MDVEDEMTVLNVKLAEEEQAIQHGLSPIREEVVDGVKSTDEVAAAKSSPTTEPIDAKKKKKRRVNEDIYNILMLLGLYILQGYHLNYA